MSDGPSKVERWENADVRLLISIWSDHKHLFGGKSTKKEIFDKIAEQFTATSGRLVTWEQCMRKWSKLLAKQKEVEDHNNKSGNDRKSWKFYNELSQCLGKDVSVKPTYTMESSSNPLDCDGRKPSDDDESSSESVVEGPQSSDSAGKRKASAKKRCRKKPMSRSSAAEMLEFLKTYSEKREKAEEEKLRILKEMSDQKTAFFDRFFQFMEKSKNN